MGYFGPVLEKRVDDVRIGELHWVNQDNLSLVPGKEIATIEDSLHKPLISVTYGLKSQTFDETDIRNVISMLRNANTDLNLGDVVIPKESLNEVANALEKRANLYF